MTNWEKYTIGDLCEVGRGSSPRPIIDQRYFKGGTIPWIKIADATSSGKYIYETNEHVNEFGASFSRYLDKGSLIIAASGVSLGQIKFLGVKGCIHDGWLYTSNFKDELINKEFLYYFLIYYSEGFHNFSSGAAIQNINTDILRKTIIALPPISVQETIVSIISAYDDLIEVNNQRIKLLEETARELYKEWFVRMRFPGYKKAKFVKGCQRDGK
ncbi:MAG: restriction endonuclease subunit S [Saprospiraceae bacterium]|nr:restriction endonuclease subunit S [Candidatus Vicinibacter affinis]